MIRRTGLKVSLLLYSSFLGSRNREEEREETGLNFRIQTLILYAIVTSMSKLRISPEITHLSWGRIETDGEKVYKDAKLYPGGSREWDWRETGTAHVPGIQPADVEELIQQGATAVILSSGFNGRLQVCPETLDWLRQREIPTYVLQTEEGVRRYNELREHEPVGGLFHSTC